MSGILDCIQEDYERLQAVEQKYLQLLDLTAQMRSAQKAYFRNRDQGNLKTAKALEKAVDQVLAEHQAPAADGTVQLAFPTSPSEDK